MLRQEEIIKRSSSNINTTLQSDSERIFLEWMYILESYVPIQLNVRSYAHKTTYKGDG